MIWLRAEVAATLDAGVHGVRDALQVAIKLEHSTIPPYLYALYSLKPGSNSKIAKIISSILTEEMLHMALVCNVLNAIDGSPDIGEPHFIPNYPGPLPGGVEKNLVVNLAPFSLPVVTGTFMVIEEPEKKLDFPILPHPCTLDLAAFPIDKRPITIGDFYRKIMKKIRALGSSIFTGDPSRQLKTVFGKVPLFAVTDENSAEQAIMLVVRQGEGTKTSPLDDEGNPAHFYRFAEIYKRFTLIPNPNPRPGSPPYVFGGDPVPFDPKGVWPVILNPHTSTYIPGSAADQGNRDFNRMYTRMLRNLHAAFNGEPDRIAIAVADMGKLRRQGQYLMSLKVQHGHAGPSFEYDPDTNWTEAER